MRKLFIYCTETSTHVYKNTSQVFDLKNNKWWGKKICKKKKSLSIKSFYNRLWKGRKTKGKLIKF